MCVVKLQQWKKEKKKHCRLRNQLHRGCSGSFQTPRMVSWWYFCIVFFNDVNRNRTLECRTCWCKSVIASVKQRVKLQPSDILAQVWMLQTPELTGWCSKLKLFSETNVYLFLFFIKKKVSVHRRQRKLHTLINDLHQWSSHVHPSL